MARPSGTCTTPNRAMRWAEYLLTSSPATRMEPPLTGTRPETTRASVDFPAPFEPTRAMIPPSGTVNDTPNKARYVL